MLEGLSNHCAELSCPPKHTTVSEVNIFRATLKSRWLAAYTYRNEHFVLVRSNRAMTVAAQNGRLYASVSPAGDGPHQQERLRPRRDGVGQRGVRRFMRQILPAGEEPHKRTALLRDVIADRPAQHRI